ncbi:MAG: RHS repeat-associated core domain-containing protein [Bacteroidales bacterium]
MQTTVNTYQITSKLGDLGSFGVDPRREEFAGSEVSGTEMPDYKSKYSALQQVVKDNYQLFEVDYYAKDNDDYVNGAGFCCDDASPQLKSIPTTGDAYEKLQYYYHPDHLGSASYITNLDGEVVQHIEYVPFGEVFLEERNNTWNTPYLFNGKEYDSETGLYYYGARYYNPRISLWYGVDPLAEKYPSMSPYNYCVNNPIMFIDPDGRDGWTRFWGGLQAVGSVFELVGAAALIVTPEPTMMTKVGGVALAVNGADNFQAGVMQLWTGETQETLLHKGVSTGAKALGADEGTAETIATTVEISTAVVGSTAGAIKTAKTASKTSQISKYAKENKIYSGQKAVVKSKVDDYYNAMKNGTYNSEKGGAGYFHEGKTIITDGNHRMNAAIKYANETGETKYIDDLIKNGNFHEANPKNYIHKIYKLPTSE